MFSHCGIDVVLGQIPIHIKTENGRHTLVRSMGPVNLHGLSSPDSLWLCHSQRVMRLLLSLAASTLQGVRLQEVAVVKESPLAFGARQARALGLGLPIPC